MASPISSRRVLVVSFLVDLLDVVTNLVVAWITGSAVVFAEMAQGVADAVGSALLVIGERRAARPRDAEHPLGYAREAFFWGLLSAVAMLVIGAGLSGWRGYQQLVAPEPLESPLLAIAVLVLAVVTNGYAVSLSARKLMRPGVGLRRAFLDPGRPLVKSALLRDAVGTFTSIVGLAALLCYQQLGLVIFDAAGAIAAALLMFAASLVLMAQLQGLITGRSLPKRELARVSEAVRATPGVEAVNQLAAIYSGAAEVLIDADLDLAEDLDTARIETLLDDLEQRIRAVLADTGKVRVQLNSPEPSSKPRGHPAQGAGG
jgi:cation diffusion facilitator family transporter